MKLLKLTPDGRCSVVEVEEFDLNKQLDQMYQIIGCSTIEIVRLPHNTGCLIVDESGLLKKDPQLNPMAAVSRSSAQHSSEASDALRTAT